MISPNAPCSELPAAIRRAAQRHSPVDRRSPSSCGCWSTSTTWTGTTPGTSRVATFGLHQPHPAAGGAGELAARAVRASRCRAIWRSSTRSTAASSTRCARSSPATRTGCARMSLIDEDGEQAASAWPTWPSSAATPSTASPRCTPTAREHSVLKDFYEMWPERFSNKTNGVTPRRFLALANPDLRELLDDTIGDGWLTDLDRLRGLEPFADDAAFRGAMARRQARDKARLAEYVRSADRCRAQSRLAVRHSGQAHSRVQAAAPQRAAHHQRCTIG